MLWYIILVFLLEFAASERIVIHTKGDEKAYNFFPLKTNYLEFTVKANHNIQIALTNTYGLDFSFYEIIIGGQRNTRSEMWRDGFSAPVGAANSTVINPNKFQTYWIVITENDASIAVGTEINKALLYYKDPHFVKKTYFGIATGFGSPGLWNFDLELLKCYYIPEEADE